MPVEPYLTFNGRCEEAIEFYKKALLFPVASGGRRSRRAQKVAMLQMRKIDSAALQRAYEQR